jgi:N-acetylmuramoyl-L-alanine amidase
VRAARVAALLGLALLLMGVERPEGLGDIVDVRHWSYPDYTRIVVELDRPVTTEVVRLEADPSANRPERLYLDLDGVWVGRSYAAGIPVGDGLLRAVRLGQNTLRRTRVVLDLERYERYRLLELSHPHRIVVDVYGHRGGDVAVRRDPSGPMGLPPELRPVKTVVVDAGHGGRDPGAIGIGGLREKDVTLKIARQLGKELEDEGIRVVYTRSDDRALTLEERTVIAESAGGDLFVSVHANASKRRSVQGVETFYLDENYERHSLNLAARENGIPRGEVNILQRTLAKLHMEEVSPHSHELARAVQSRVVTGLPSKERPQDLGVKKGPFYVLFLSNMPAVLVEVGFITNRTEARRLRDDDYIEAIAEQIAAGVVHYRGERQTRLARSKAP